MSVKDTRKSVSVIIRSIDGRTPTQRNTEPSSKKPKLMRTVSTMKSLQSVDDPRPYSDSLCRSEAFQCGDSEISDDPRPYSLTSRQISGLCERLSKRTRNVVPPWQCMNSFKSCTLHQVLEDSLPRPLFSIQPCTNSVSPCKPVRKQERVYAERSVSVSLELLSKKMCCEPSSKSGRYQFVDPREFKRGTQFSNSSREHSRVAAQSDLNERTTSRWHNPLLEKGFQSVAFSVISSKDDDEEHQSKFSEKFHKRHTAPKLMNRQNHESYFQRMKSSDDSLSKNEMSDERNTLKEFHNDRSHMKRQKRENLEKHSSETETYRQGRSASSQFQKIRGNHSLQRTRASKIPEWID